MRNLFIIIILAFSFMLLNGLYYGTFSVSYEERLLHIINDYRKQNGLEPLIFDRKLTEIAEGHSDYMNKRNTLSHDFFIERFNRSESGLCVENVGWNAETPEVQFRLWRESGSHNANILNNKIKRAGISRKGSYVTFFGCY